ncbi:MAG: cell envelope integrity protein TolA [Gammaproteobacteria bacterium]
MLAAADARFVPRPVPKLAAGALALGVHVLFVVMLVFGVSWQTQPAGPVSVDLWQALPAVPPSRPKPQPAPPPEPVKSAPARPAPAPKPAETPPRAPDIALEKKKVEAERAKQVAADKARADAAREKQLAEQKQRELQRQQEEADMMRRMAAEEAAEAATLTQQAEARAAASRRQAAVAGVVGQYRDLISAKVRGNTRLPDNLAGNPEVRIRVRLLPTGEVQSVQLTRSSGNPAYDDAVLRAIEKSSPLPLPADRDARAAFVPELSFVHRPKE